MRAVALTACDAVSPSRIVALLVAALEYAAGERAVVIMTTSPGLGVIPDAGRAEVGTPVCSTRLLIRQDLHQGVRSIVVLYYFTIELTGVYARIIQAGGTAPDPLVAPIYRFLIGLASGIEALILALHPP